MSETREQQTERLRAQAEIIDLLFPFLPAPLLDPHRILRELLLQGLLSADATELMIEGDDPDDWCNLIVVQTPEVISQFGLQYTAFTRAGKKFIVSRDPTLGLSAIRSGPPITWDVAASDLLENGLQVEIENDDATHLEFSVVQMANPSLANGLTLHWWAIPNESPTSGDEEYGSADFAPPPRSSGVARVSVPLIANATYACAIADKS